MHLIRTKKMALITLATVAIVFALNGPSDARAASGGHGGGGHSSGSVGHGFGSGHPSGDSGIGSMGVTSTGATSTVVVSTMDSAADSRSGRLIRTTTGMTTHRRTRTSRPPRGGTAQATGRITRM
jgi:hypothetical protein